MEMKRSEASFLILEEAAADYHLSGPLGEFLSMVAELKYLTIQELIGDLTLDSVLKFEKELEQVTGMCFYLILSTSHYMTVFRSFVTNRLNNKPIRKLNMF
jgi:hypothetical protein